MVFKLVLWPTTLLLGNNVFCEHDMFFEENKRKRRPVSHVKLSRARAACGARKVGLGQVAQVFVAGEFGSIC